MSEPILTWRIVHLPNQDDSTSEGRIELRCPAVGLLTHTNICCSPPESVLDNCEDLSSSRGKKL